MKFYLCASSDLHPYECGHDQYCEHCTWAETEWHHPDRCALCKFTDFRWVDKPYATRISVEHYSKRYQKIQVKRHRQEALAL